MDPQIPSSTRPSFHQPEQSKVRSSVSQTYGYDQPGADLDAQGQKSHDGAEQIVPWMSAQDANLTKVSGQYTAAWGPEKEQEYEEWHDSAESPPVSSESKAIFQHALSVRKAWDADLPDTITCQFSGAVREGSFNRCNTILFSDGIKWILKRMHRVDKESWSPEQQDQMDNTFNLIMHIRRVTGIPIPFVYKWSSSFDNPLGMPYVLERCADGQTVVDTLAQLDDNEDAQGRILTRTTIELSGYLQKLRDYASYDKIGTPVYRQGRYLGLTSTYTPWSQFVGPFENAADHLFHQFDIEQQGRGPSCEGVLLRLFMNWLKQVSKHERTFTLYHPDCNMANVLIDEAGSITAIIDWDFIQAGPSYLAFPAIPRMICSEWYDGDRGEFNNLRAKVQPTRCCTGMGDNLTKLPDATELNSRHTFWDRIRVIWEEACRIRESNDSPTNLDLLSAEEVGRWWHQSGVASGKCQPFSFSGLFLQNIAEGCFVNPADAIVTHILAHMVVQDRQSRLGETLGYGPLLNVRLIMGYLNNGILLDDQMDLIKQHFYRMLYYPTRGQPVEWNSAEIQQDSKLLCEVGYLKQNSSNGVHPFRYMLQYHEIDYAALKKDAVRAKWKAAAQSRTRQPYTDIGKKFSVVLPQNEIAQALRKMFGCPKGCCRGAKNRLLKDMRGLPRPQALSPEKETLQEYLIQMLWLVKHDRQLQNLVFGRVVYKPSAGAEAAKQTPPEQSQHSDSKAAETVQLPEEVPAQPSNEEPVRHDSNLQEQIEDLKRELAEQRKQNVELKQQNQQIMTQLAENNQVLDTILSVVKTRLPRGETRNQISAKQTNPGVVEEGAAARAQKERSSESAIDPNLEDSGYVTSPAAFVDARQPVTKGAEAQEASASKLVERPDVSAEQNPRPTSAPAEPRHDALSSSESSSFVDAVEYRDELPQASDPQDRVQASGAQSTAPNLLTNNAAAPQPGPLQPGPAGLPPAPARSILARVGGWFRGWGDWLRNLPDTDTGGGEIDRLLNGEFDPFDVAPRDEVPELAIRKQRLRIAIYATRT
ncbi:MAG: hypothetical protein Q9159_003843 [Coniocarpon cinnabarinum]